MSFMKKCCDWACETYYGIRIYMHHIYCYVKCHTFHPYNRVKIDTLPPTYQDKDIILPHAMFQILADFIEQECSPGNIDWDSNAGHKRVRKTMQELYDWWNNVYLTFDPWVGYNEKKGTKDHFKNGVFHCNKYDDAWFEKIRLLEDDMEKQLTKNLKKLIDIRGYLWT